MATKNRWTAGKDARAARLARTAPGATVRIKVWRCSIGYGYDVLAYNEDGTLDGAIREERFRQSAAMVTANAVRWAEGKGYVIGSILLDRQQVTVTSDGHTFKVERVKVDA